MLLGIDPLLRGPLLGALDLMGHGDLVVVVDANFPAHRIRPDAIAVVGWDAPTVLRAIRTVFPVDPLEPVTLMAAPGDELLPVQLELLAAAASDGPLDRLDRHDFYEIAATAQVVVQTGETRAYGNAVLRKGVAP